MRFRPVSKGVMRRHIVDDDTGIEFFEKNWTERVKRWTREGVDHRRYGVVFVFRDPRWSGAGGSHEIEFKAIGRERIVEEKSQRTLEVNRAAVIYGFDIVAADFDRSFASYTGDDTSKSTCVRDFIRAAILFYLGAIPSPEVNFT